MTKLAQWHINKVTQYHSYIVTKWQGDIKTVRDARYNLTALDIVSKDARLPVQLQRAMAAEAEAAREARAKVRAIAASEFWQSSCLCVQVIAAEGEQKASKSLAEASMVMAGSCSALQIRYLQVSTRWSGEKKRPPLIQNKMSFSLKVTVREWKEMYLIKVIFLTFCFAGQLLN